VKSSDFSNGPELCCRNYTSWSWHEICRYFLGEVWRLQWEYINCCGDEIYSKSILNHLAFKCRAENLILLLGAHCLCYNVQYIHLYRWVFSSMITMLLYAGTPGGWQGRSWGSSGHSWTMHWYSVHVPPANVWSMYIHVYILEGFVEIYFHQ